MFNKEKFMTALAKKEITMTDFSKLIEVHFRTVQAWKYGQFVPNDIHAEKIKNILGDDIFKN